MALLFKTSAPTAGLWREELCRLLPGLDFRVWPEIGNPRDIEVALVWHPPAGLLKSLPNLRLIASLGAGVDHLFADPELPPDVPIMRLVDPHMVQAMSEYVVLEVLRLHRHDLAYAAQQGAREWREHRPQPNAPERRVGILGLGQFGTDAALKLRALGFDVGGWSRRPKKVEGIRCHHGEAGLETLLRTTEIAVCLLPLTPATEGILGRRSFALMPRGAMIVNVGRGRHLVEADLLEALDSGQIGGAVLDVFHEEPLPPDHPFWRHPRIAVTPHIAALTNPATASAIVAGNIRRLRRGEALQDLVDRAQSY